MDDDGMMFAINEAKNKLIKIDTNGYTQRDQKLKDMKGYKKIAGYFEDPVAIKLWKVLLCKKIVYLYKRRAIRECLLRSQRI